MFEDITQYPRTQNEIIDVLDNWLGDFYDKNGRVPTELEVRDKVIEVRKAAGEWLTNHWLDNHVR